jgi:hypothetical protein
MTLGRLPTPWDDDSTWMDLEGLADTYAQTGPVGPERMFADVLREAASARDALQHQPGENPRACTAQLVLGLAAALARPEFEQWAVKWLEHLGRPYLRQWWRHASADRRVVGEFWMTAPVKALGAEGAQLLTGDRDGRIHRHDMARGMSAQPLALGEIPGAVWVIAVRNGTVVAGGAGNELLIMQPDRTERVPHERSAITAAATDGSRVACGFETGEVWVDGTELKWPDSDDEHPAVLALAFTADGALACVRADGEIAEHREGLELRHTHSRFKRVRTASWHPSAEIVALGEADGDVVVLRRFRDAWETRVLAAKHLSVAALGWSADGSLASAGYDRRIWITEGLDGPQPRYRSLRTASPASVLAFTDKFLVAGHSRRLIAWQRAAGRGGRALTVPDEVTVLGLDPSRPEVLVSATSHGLLRQHDSAGRIRHDPGRVHGRVHRVAPASTGWYVAGSTGLFHWRPGESITRIGGPSRVVAAGKDGLWVAGCGKRVLVNLKERYRHDTTVVDAIVSDSGSVVTLDDEGGMRIDQAPAFRLPPGRRLLCMSGGAVLFVSVIDGTVYRHADGAVTRLWSAGSTFTRAVAMTPEFLAVAYRGGEVAIVRADNGHRVAGIHLHASALAADGGRLAAAAGDEVSLFNLVIPGPSPVSDELELRVDAMVDAGGRQTYVARLPDGSRWAMGTDLHRQVMGLVSEIRPGTEPSRDLTLQVAERLRGWLGAAGLRLSLDRMIGHGIPLPVRLRLAISGSDLDVLPWELAVDHQHFEVVRSAKPMAKGHAPASGRVRLLALRAPDREFATFSRIFPSILDRFPRGLELQADEIPPVASEQQLREVLSAPADIVILLAHAGPRHLTLTPGHTIDAEKLAESLAGATPRLVILAACQSVNLARHLADKGTPAVIALRTRESVWALEQLLEELLVSVMSGVTLEDAFAVALERCTRLPETGMPVLYMSLDAPRPFTLVPTA